MGRLRLAYRRILHAIDNHGLWGTVTRLFRIRAPAERRQNGSGERDNGQHPFDLAFGVDTGGYVPGERLGTVSDSGSDLYNTAYYGISPSTLRAALQHVPVAFASYVFVDLGCGKGRALLVAAELPFPALIGVDLDGDLCRRARENVAALPGIAGRVEIRNEDALLVRYPDRPLLIYMYHPFLAPLLRKVLVEIENQFRVASREMYLLFANAIYFDMLAQIPCLEMVWDYDFPLSAEDAAADRHGTTAERYTLYRLR